MCGVTFHFLLILPHFRLSAQPVRSISTSFTSEQQQQQTKNQTQNLAKQQTLPGSQYHQAIRPPGSQTRAWTRRTTPFRSQWRLHQVFVKCNQWHPKEWQLHCAVHQESPWAAPGTQQRQIQLVQEGSGRADHHLETRTRSGTGQGEDCSKLFHHCQRNSRYFEGYTINTCQAVQIVKQCDSFIKNEQIWAATNIKSH